MTDHCLACECADCLNRGGGLVLAGAGRTYPNEEKQVNRHNWELREYWKTRRSRKKAMAAA